jgi:hypothetical protein
VSLRRYQHHRPARYRAARPLRSVAFRVDVQALRKMHGTPCPAPCARVADRLPAGRDNRHSPPSLGDHENTPKSGTSR